MTAAEALRPFDLARGPLFRTLLLRAGASEWTLVLAMHHIVSDGWSMGVMLRELEALYGASLAGAPSPLPELPVQYADYAVWQREWLRGEVLEGQLAYWRERLAGHPPVLELPADRPRPAVQMFRGASEPVVLGAQLTGHLKALSRRRGEPLFMTALAGFLAFLQRYTGQSDLLVGTPSAGRTRLELEGLIGFFVNTLVLRTDASGDPLFAELTDRARESALGAYAHGDLPLERIVEELAPERSLGYSPLFQVAFALQTAPRDLPRLAGLEAEELPLSIDTAKFDLTLSLTETAEGLAGGLEYNRDLFDAATAHRMADHLRNLLAAAATDAAARLSELLLLSAAERRELLVDWNATRAPFPDERSIHRLVAERARQTPAAVAVIDEMAAEGGRVTYGELDARADTLARRLRAVGVGPETLVALCVERSIEMVVAMLAILKAGGAYVPLDPSYPSERLAFLLADTRAPVLLTQERLAALLPAAGGVRVILLDCPAEETSEGSEEMAGEAAGTGFETGGDHLAYVIYTSGSTGQPKGVAVPHRAVLRLVLNTDYVRLSPADRIAQAANASFDAATFEVWGSLLNGGSLVILPQAVVLSPAALAADIRRHGIQAMFLTTALFNQVAREEPGAFAPLTDLLFGGEAVDPGWVRAVLRDGPPKRLLHVYGPTESTTFSTWFEIRSLEPGAVTVPIGKPIANTRAYVLDPGLRPAPAGVHGSLYVGGDGLARGYLNRPELTAERFVPDPFAGETGTEPGGRLYATGDLVRYLPDGNVEFLGRADQQVKIRGFRIELGEIETVLAAHPRIREAAVLAREEGAAGKRLVAYAATAGPAPEVGEVREHMRSKLPDYMVPSAFVWLEALPLTPNGKVDRRALARLEAATAADVESYLAPRTTVEKALARMWAELLEVDPVGIRDDFFHLGGHSLLAIQVLSRVRRLFGVELSIRTLFESPTVEGLARSIGREQEGRRAEAGPALSALARGRELPLSFAQARLWFLDRLQPGSAIYNIPLAYRLRGELAPGALAASLGEIVRRHEALRTRFAEAADGPVQVIEPAGAFVLPQVDLGGLPEPARRPEEERLTREEALRPFDLARGPLFRPLLLRVGGSEWVLILAMHHIVSDGWSMGVMLRELAALYGAVLAGFPSPLAELPMQYADFAVWQREWLRGEELESRLAYWRERLAGSPPVLELPTDRSRPAAPTLRVAEEPLSLGPEVSERLRNLSRRSGAPLFMTLLAGFLALLHRYTGETDLLVGTPQAGRNREEIEGLIGFFVNTLVLRTDVAGDPAFSELLGRVRQTALGAYAHGDLPFERLVEELAPDRSLGFSPLFQVTFSLETEPAGLPRIEGLEVEPLELSLAGAKFDLTVAMTEMAEGLTGVVVYSRDLFDAATARRIGRHLEILLAGAAAQPQARLSELPLLSAAERRELLVEWNATLADLPRQRSIHGLFAERARQAPGAVAVTAEGARITYGEARGAGECSGRAPARRGRRAGGARRPLRRALDRPGGGDAGDPQSRWRLRTARSVPPARAPDLPVGGQRGAGAVDPGKPGGLAPSRFPLGPGAGDPARPPGTGGRRRRIGGRAGRRGRRRSPGLRHLHLRVDRAPQGSAGAARQRHPAVLGHPPRVRLRAVGRLDGVPLGGLRLLGLGDLGGAAPRRPPGDGAARDHPVASLLPRVAGDRTCDGAQPDPVGVPAAHPRRRRGGRDRPARPEVGDLRGRGARSCDAHSLDRAARR